MKKKYIIAVVILALVGLGAYLRFRTSEDSWICQNGQWVKHGNPASPEPTYPCTFDGQKVLDTSVEANMSNPAAKNCLQKGGTLKQLQETAGILGICQFADGTECEEWQFFRNECQIGQYKTADTSHPYLGTISKRGLEYFFKTDGNTEYNLQLPAAVQKETKDRLVAEAKAQEPVTIIAAETPPLSKILILKGFQEK